VAGAHKAFAGRWRGRGRPGRGRSRRLALPNGVPSREGEAAGRRRAVLLMCEPTSNRAADDSPPFAIRPAAYADWPAAGAVYVRAFPDSRRDLHSPDLKPEAVADLLAVVHAVDPGAIMVAEGGGAVVGYIVAPSDVHAVRRAVLREGLRFAWLWRWLGGRYGLTARGALRLLRDQVHLRRSSAVPDYPAHVLSVAVDPEWQARGVGRALAEAALRRFRELGIPAVRLEVRPANAAAQHLYRTLGFRAVGETRDSRGRWIVMVADLAARRVDDAPQG
jgi:ribosomal protein S18 acetylase RimI-like enzyme